MSVRVRPIRGGRISLNVPRLLTRAEAEQLRDDLTAALNDHTGETPAERAHRELHEAPVIGPGIGTEGTT